MINITIADQLQDGIVFDRKYRFKHPEVVIRTWYGLKIYGGGKWWRLRFKDKIVYDKTLFLLDLDIKKVTK